MNGALTKEWKSTANTHKRQRQHIGCDRNVGFHAEAYHGRNRNQRPAARHYTKHAGQKENDNQDTEVKIGHVRFRTGEWCSPRTDILPASVPILGLAYFASFEAATKSSTVSGCLVGNLPHARERGDLLANSQPLAHLLVQKPFSSDVRLHPFAIDDELRDRAFAGAFYNFIHRPRRGFNIDLFVWNVVLRQKTLGLAAIRTPCR